MSSNEPAMIQDAKRNCWPICIYGLGYLGKRLFREIPGIFRLTADMYCDSKDENVDSINLEGMVPVHLDELMKMDTDVLVFVLIDDPFDLEVSHNLRNNSHLHILTLRELVEMDIVFVHYFGEELFTKYSRLITG